MRSDGQDKLMGEAARALAWNYAGTGVRTGLSLVVGIILARLLGPGPFGLLAIAALVMGIGTLVSEFGLGPALVQRPAICAGVIRFTFTVQVALGLAAAVIVGVLAWPIAWAFGIPEAAGVVRAMAPIFAIQGCGATAAALLRRALRFKSLQAAELGSYAVGFCGLGLPLALLGWGVWSLVAAQLAQASIFTVVCYGFTRHSMRPLWRAPDAGLQRFGWQVLRTNVTNWVIGNLDNVVVGRTCLAPQLGLYSRIFSLLGAPVTALVPTLQRVLFPAYSRAQADPARMRDTYLASIAFMSLLMIPAYGCAALLAPVVVRGLLGSGWEGASDLLVPLALAMPLHALMALGGPLLWAANRVRDEARAQAITAGASMVLFVAAASVSMKCVAWAVPAIYLIRFVLVTRAVLAASGLGWADIWRAVRGGAMVMAVSGPVVVLVDGALPSATTAAFRLLADGMIGVIAAGGVVLLAPRHVAGAELASYAGRLAEGWRAVIGAMPGRMRVDGELP